MDYQVKSKRKFVFSRHSGASEEKGLVPFADYKMKVPSFMK
jgi:hypothetical protein